MTDDTVSVKELRDFLADQPDEARVQLAGIGDTALIGWTDSRRTQTPDGRPVVLLAFGWTGETAAVIGPSPTWPSDVSLTYECPSCGAEVDTREARAL